MKSLIDLTNNRFGKLIVVKEVDRVECPDGLNKTRWRRRFLCKCDCGNEKIIRMMALSTGHAKSCGCLRWKHNHTQTGIHSPTYSTWSHMTTRCTNEKHNAYHNYGGRGITICTRWQGENGFINFLDDMGVRPQGMTLDRYPDTNGNYEPDNCRWATHYEQSRNKRKNIWIEYNGKKMVQTDWAHKLNIDYGTLNYRLKNWSLEEAMQKNTVTNYRRLTKEEISQIKSLLNQGYLGKEVSRMLNVHRTTVSRIKLEAKQNEQTSV